ncbi:hypothetical protein [Streptomyces sp. NPDC091383]|uniref:hypothetical protein n=1 Tax=Streptomyces sp. NPDC091383 TaxID=3365996 RepID=UPI00381BE9B4
MNRIKAAHLPGILHPSVVVAASLGQCSCGRPVVGIQYTADRDGNEDTINLPCGHPRIAGPEAHCGCHRELDDDASAAPAGSEEKTA